MAGVVHRRLFLKRSVGSLAAVAGGGVVLSACTGDPEDGSADPADAANVGHEAEMLAELVEAGDLPPVEERLPEDVLTVEPVEEIGTYGGAWNTALLGPADTNWLSRTIGYENLVRWVPDWTGAPGTEDIVPNIVASFDFDDEGLEYTFTLRRGHKWSDGTPFTVEDIAFAYNEVLLNQELYPHPPSDFTSNGVPARLEILDENTFSFSFDSPNGLFLPRLCTTGGRLITQFPQHYAKQFHPEHNPQLDDLVDSEGYEHWTELFAARTDSFANPDQPVHDPWIVTTPLAEGARVVAERNPYYFKVDPDGNQLPYLDQVIFQVVQDDQVMLTKAMGGEIDMHVRHFNIPANKPVLAQNRQEGDYEFFDTVTAEMNTLVLMLNLTHQDPAKNELLNNQDFRIGLSHAIDRAEIIDAVYQRQGEPWQVAPRPESVFYDEQMAKQHTEYDVDLANEYLDRAGYTDRSGDIRVGPDGQPIVLSIDFATGIQPEWADALELIRGYWRAVGVDVHVNPIDRSLHDERRMANEHDITVWLGGGGIDVVLNPYWYAPLSNRSDYAQLWAAWYQSGGEEGSEPPEAAKRQMELYDELRSFATVEDQERLMREILTIARDEFYSIGVGLPAPGYGIVRTGFHNVPEEMPGAWTYPTPAPTNPEQYFKS